MKKILQCIFNRMIIVGVLILIQLGLILLVILKLSTYFVYFYIASLLVSMAIVIFLVSKTDNPSYKLAWIIAIMSFPIVGGFFYLIAGSRRLSKRFVRKLEAVFKEIGPHLNQEEGIIEKIEAKDKHAARQVRYIKDYSHYPIYENTITKYLSPGEAFFEVLMSKLEKAKHFIFLEYFIIQEGRMWNTVLEILERKAKQGVEVRLIYDDIGCLKTLPYKYNEVLEKKGIKCKVFNPLAPVLNIMMNNRDHRKITVIDGYMGFVGGINLADEYINEIVKHGHWKDAALYMEGEAVWNLTAMFLETWCFDETVKEDIACFKPHAHHSEAFETDGFVQPYGDSPLDHETVGENVYLNLLHKAKEYVYISTPYLVVDNEMVTALILAAKSGVDVRIITPHIEDKWYVHIVTRAYYKQLIEAGIKIYEYAPGFIHSKTVVADDETAIVGSINMDYRSLYLHFECAAWLYESQAVYEVKMDYLETLNACIPISLEDCNKVNLRTRLLRAVLRLFAPLM